MFIILKDLLSHLLLALELCNVTLQCFANNLQEIMAFGSLASVKLNFDPCFKVKWGKHPKIVLYLLIIPSISVEFNL